MNFSTVTACGEDCAGCKKRQDGLCPGCIEADGHVPEWEESGGCRVHACVKEHGVRFCGICPKFPCKRLPQLIHWNPGIVEHLRGLREEWLGETAAAEGDCV